MSIIDDVIIATVKVQIVLAYSEITIMKVQVQYQNPGNDHKFLIAFPYNLSMEMNFKGIYINCMINVRKCKVGIAILLI